MTKSNVLLGESEERAAAAPLDRIVLAVLAQWSWLTVCAHPVQRFVRRATEEQRCYPLPPG